MDSIDIDKVPSDRWPLDFYTFKIQKTKTKMIYIIPGGEIYYVCMYVFIQYSSFQKFINSIHSIVYEKIEENCRLDFLEKNIASKIFLKQLLSIKDRYE
jgi:hypothetical protein